MAIFHEKTGERIDSPKTKAAAPSEEAPKAPVKDSVPEPEAKPAKPNKKG